MDTEVQTPVYELNLRIDPRIPFRVHRGILAQSQTLQNWHENTEFLYCISGAGEVTYNDRVIPFQAGQLIVVNSEMFHSVRSDGQMYFHCLTLDRHFCADSGISTTQLYFREQIDDAQLCGDFLRILEALELYEQSGDTYPAALVRARALEFLYRLCRDHLLREKGEENSVSGRLVRSAMTYIRKNLSQPMTLDEIAEAVGVNKYHMSRQFKRAVGRTVFDTILQLRCAAARELIERGSLISRAAQASGFENMSYFTRAFKKYYGILPSQCVQKPEV